MENIEKPLTIEGLINILNKFNKNLRVIVPGFDECYLDDIYSIKEVNVIFRDQYESGHCGPHKEAENGEGQKAILIC